MSFTGHRRVGEARQLNNNGRPKKDNVDISPEIDNLINAATRPFNCYRKSIYAYYENDKISKSFCIV